MTTMCKTVFFSFVFLNSNNNNSPLKIHPRKAKCLVLAFSAWMRRTKNQGNSPIRSHGKCGLKRTPGHLPGHSETGLKSRKGFIYFYSQFYFLPAYP